MTAMLSRGWLSLMALGAVIVAIFVLIQSRSQAESSVSALAQQTHFHGLAIDAADPSRLYLATHHGLYAVTPDGTARQISATSDDFMGFTPHPTDPSLLYASGHPARGGNLGFIVSTDRGRSWAQLSEGAGGPVDFHQMGVSPADPKVVYGAYGGHLQVSKDGGRNWEIIGPAPNDIIDLTASADDAGTLYAATEGGLLKSEDSGQTWQEAYWLRKPATMVHTTPKGEVYAFVVDSGLIKTTEPQLTWRTLSNELGSAYVMHFAVDPADESRLYAATLRPESHQQAIVASRDGGKTWHPLDQAGG